MELARLNSLNNRSTNHVVHVLAAFVALLIYFFSVRKARADEPDRCGYTPLRTGPWDPFVEACRLHDYYYVHKGVVREEADRAFAAIVRNIYKASPWWKRPLLSVWGEAYILIVAAVGGKFW